MQEWFKDESLRDGGIDKQHQHPPHHDSRHDQQIASFSLSFDGALDWTAFGIWLTMLMNRHGENVLRVKGILNVRDMDVPIVINGVQHLVHPPAHLNAWPSPDRRSHLVFITRGMDQARLRRSLAAFNRLSVEAVAA